MQLYGGDIWIFIVDRIYDTYIYILRVYRGSFFWNFINIVTRRDCCDHIGQIKGWKYSSDT